MPLDPLTTAVQIGQWFDTHSQLTAIRQTLSHLQLINTVGAAASVAGLGVSVAGFAVVLNRLERFEANVQASMEKIRAEVALAARWNPSTLPGQWNSSRIQIRPSRSTGIITTR
jgi:hypothetical protein